MADAQPIFSKPTRRIIALALVIFALDQFTKWLVLHTIYEGDEITVIPGFFNLAHRANTGAAWSLFTGNNTVLAVVALVALVALFLARNHFHARTLTGQLALGLVFGGIIGNLTDRLRDRYVTDFLYFHLDRRGGSEIGFPAFNIADSAICVGVTLIFLVSLKNEKAPAKPVQPPA